MKDELKFGTLLKYMKVINESDVNRFIRPNETQVAILKDTRLDLLPKVLLRKITLIKKRTFCRYLRKTHLELSCF